MKKDKLFSTTRNTVKIQGWYGQNDGQVNQGKEADSEMIANFYNQWVWSPLPLLFLHKTTANAIHKENSFD